MADLRNFQQWLNQRGAAPQLKLDGLAGPATRNAVFQVFKNVAAPPVTAEEVQAVAAKLGCTTRQIMAVAMTESAGSGWDSSGMMKILYERHFLWRRIQVKVPFLADPTPGGYTVDADGDGINDSWEKLADAALRWGPEFAFECASYGKFQIMGAWWQRLGYPSAVEFAYGMTRSEGAHYEALARYITQFKLVPALRAISGNPETCRAFAKGYNGAAYEKNKYHAKIASNYLSAR